eukprot:6206119-Pleurochrysis_carterae.AAC.1
MQSVWFNKGLSGASTANAVMHASGMHMTAERLVTCLLVRSLSRLAPQRTPSRRASKSAAHATRPRPSGAPPSTPSAVRMLCDTRSNRSTSQPWRPAADTFAANLARILRAGNRLTGDAPGVQDGGCLEHLTAKASSKACSRVRRPLHARRPSPPRAPAASCPAPPPPPTTRALRATRRTCAPYRAAPPSSRRRQTRSRRVAPSGNRSRTRSRTPSRTRAARPVESRSATACEAQQNVAARAERNVAARAERNVAARAERNVTARAERNVTACRAERDRVQSGHGQIDANSRTRSLKGRKQVELEQLARAEG